MNIFFEENVSKCKNEWEFGTTTKTWLYFVFKYINNIENAIAYLKLNNVDDSIDKIDKLENKKLKGYKMIEFELMNYR